MYNILNGAMIVLVKIFRARHTRFQDSYCLLLGWIKSRPCLYRTSEPESQKTVHKTSPFQQTQVSGHLVYCSNDEKLINSRLMEPGGSMPHSQGLSNNPYPEPNQSSSLH